MAGTKKAEDKKALIAAVAKEEVEAVAKVLEPAEALLAQIEEADAEIADLNTKIQEARASRQAALGLAIPLLRKASEDLEPFGKDDAIQTREGTLALAQAINRINAAATGSGPQRVVDPEVAERQHQIRQGLQAIAANADIEKRRGG